MFLNLDAGERSDEIDGLWSLFDVLNCACGGHAGDATSMDRVAAFCARSTVRLGAHPSYPDRAGFGRRSPLLPLTPDAAAETPALRAVQADAPAVDAARADAPALQGMAARLRTVAALVEPAVAAQCRALADIARRRRVAVVALKPHGALYHDAAAHPAIAQAVLRGAIDALGRGVTVIGPPAGALRDEAAALRLLYAREGFADRRLRSDGTLVPRSDDDALIVDPVEAAAQAAELSASVDTICIHGDTPGALAIAQAVREVIRG